MVGLFDWKPGNSTAYLQKILTVITTLYLQLSCRYQRPDFPAMLENNRNPPCLCPMPVSVVSRSYPEHICKKWNMPAREAFSPSNCFCYDGPVLSKMIWEFCFTVHKIRHLQLANCIFGIQVVIFVPDAVQHRKRAADIGQNWERSAAPRRACRSNPVRHKKMLSKKFSYMIFLATRFNYDYPMIENIDFQIV